MANEQQITEIISESAFKQLDKLYANLQKAADEYGRLGSQILDVNKEISGSKTFGDLEKALEKQILSEEKIARAKANTKIAEERLAQARQRTADIAERAAKKEADALAKSEAAIRSKQEAVERMAINEKTASDSAYDASMRSVVSEKAKQKALEASTNAAMSGAAIQKQQAADAEKNAAAEEDRRRKQAISFKGSIRLQGQENDVLSEYGLEVDNLIQKQLALRSSLKLLQSEFKELGTDATTKQTRDFTLAQESAKLAISQNGIELKRVIREQTSAEGSYARLDARLRSLRAAYQKLTPEQKENSESAKELATQISALDAELKSVDASQGVYNRNVGNYASALDSVSPAIGQFVSQLRAAYVAAQAFIATPIGAAIAALVAVVGATKAWYDYNKGLEEATRLTRQLTDLQGDDLIGLRSQVESIASVYNKDFKEVLIAANATAKSFGISYQEALDVVKNGFIAGADASGDFLNQLKEYPTQLEAVGLSADQTVALITQNIKDGLFSDKGIDAIKEAGISLREMTKSTAAALDGIGLSSKQIQDDLASGRVTMFEVVQQISSKLDELPPQSAAVGTAIADIFRGAGEDAGLQYLTTIQDIDLSLEGLVDRQGELGEAQAKQLEATEALKTEVALLFDQTGGGFELMIADIKLIATDLLVRLIRGVADLYNWFIELYNSSLLVRGIISSIGATFKQVNSAGKALLYTLIDGFSGVGNILKDILTLDFGNLPKTIDKALSSILGNFDNYGTESGEIWADAFDGAVNNRLQTIDMTSNSGGALDVALGTSYGGTGVAPTPDDPKAAAAGKRAEKEADRARKLAEKNKKELEERLLELSVTRLKAEENALRRQADAAKEIATDENNGYQDRLNNLQSYLQATEAGIIANQETQKKENKKYLDEAGRLEREGRTEDAAALRAIALEKNREIDLAVNDQRAQMVRNGNDILKTIYEDDAEDNLLRVQTNLEAEAQARLLALSEQHAAGRISDLEYANARVDISRNLARDLIENEIEITERVIELARARGVDVSDQERQVAALKIKLSKDTADSQIDDLKRVAEEEKRLKELKTELAQQLSDTTFDIINGMIERDLQRLDMDMENINTKYEEEKKAIEGSVLSEEEKNAKLFALDQKKQIQDEQIENKKAQLKTRQARLDRAQNILSIIGSTAVGIMRAFADLGPIAGIPFAAIIGAMGVAQIASVVSQPLPQYYKGTSSSKEGFAHVGERGSELMIEPNGNMLLTPDQDTVTYLQRGTKILTNDQTKKAIARKSLRGMDNRSNINVNFAKLVEESRKQGDRMVSAVKGKQYFGTVLTKNGFESQVIKGDKVLKWKRKNGI